MGSIFILIYATKKNLSNSILKFKLSVKSTNIFCTSILVKISVKYDDSVMIALLLKILFVIFKNDVYICIKVFTGKPLNFSSFCKISFILRFRSYKPNK